MSRLSLSIVLSLITFSVIQTNAQIRQNWKKLVNEAEELEKLGDLFRSAQNFEEAYSTKKEDKFTYRAGMNYMETRHYAKAVKCLEPIKNKNNEPAFDKPGYTYARALKQSGQFAEARIAFENFVNTYDGDDKEKMRDMAEAEIQGCNYALKGSEITNPNVTVELLDFNVNTDRTEFAPIPFANDILYFSSTVSGVSKIYRTQKNKKGTWMTRQVPTIFTGKMSKPHFGNGSFTPDGKRFFFTQCDLIEKGQPMCEIYLMFEEKGNWSTPIRLPDHINLSGFNTTHPFITIVEDKEILYFTSDREGGMGGMDLWYATRNLDADIVEFNLPKNLGRNINTLGDEVSPHYHYPSTTLYFSSNGRISSGGYDIYRSIGERTEWTEAENIGFPINSSADDLFYVVSDAHEGGYFISNRIFGREKQSTTNDDLFYYNEIKKQLLVKGTVYSEIDPTKTPLKDVNIKFYELNGDEKKLVHDRSFDLANEYKIILAADRNFIMDVSCNGFEVFSADISTKGIKSTETRIKDIALKPGKTVVDEPVVIVPAEYNSKENAYVLPEEMPNDPNTGEPYAADSKYFKAFMEADAIARNSDERKVYWDNGVLTALKKEIVSVEKPKVEPRFLVVPEENNSKDNPYVLPKTPPINSETGKPYTTDSDVYNAFVEANEVAMKADGRKVYWSGIELLPVEKEITEPTIDPKFVVVPEEFNSEANVYTLPKTVPLDKNGKLYAAGSDVFKFFLEADAIAKKADDRKVYWNGTELYAYKKPVEIQKEPRFDIVPAEYDNKDNPYTLPKSLPNDPKTGLPYATNTPQYSEYQKAKKVASDSYGNQVFWKGNVLVAFNPDIAPVGTSYKVQVAAMRNLKTLKYEQLSEGDLSGYTVVYEKINNGITRVLVVPQEKNEDGVLGFKQKEDAIKLLKLVVENTDFTSAFVGIYEGDKRQPGLIRLDN